MPRAAESMPATVDAIRAAAELVRWAWVQLAEGSSMSPAQQARYVEGLTDARSIIHPVGGDPLTATIVNVSPLANSIDEGHGAYHLPSRIHWASTLGAMKNKFGRYYMFIPFTHGAYRGRKGPMRTQARAMPPAVYRRARLLKPGQYLTSGPGGGRYIHTPGMTPYVPRYHRNIRPGYTHTLRQERMIRQPGRGKGSQYLTFRTMTQSSTGWWVPPQAGLHLARQAEQDTAAAVEQMLAAAMREDMAQLMTDTLGG